MVNDNETKKAWQGLGFIPFFHDHNVYEGVKLVARQRKQRVSAVILDAVKAHYMVTEKSELTYNNALEFHTAIKSAKGRGNGTVADYIERACKNHVNDFVQRLMVK